MNILNIIVAEPGKGRPVNPFDKATCSDIAKQIDCLGNNECICFKHSLFEDDVQTLAAYKSDGVTLLPVGKYKVSEMWQFRSKSTSWMSIDEQLYGVFDSYSEFQRCFSGFETRRIYIAIDAPEPIDSKYSADVKKFVEENKSAMDMIEAQEPSCYPDIILLMKDYADQQTATIQEDNKRLREALKQIDQMSDCGSYAAAVISMKNIANKALNNK